MLIMAKRKKKPPLSRYLSQWSPWHLPTCPIHLPAPKIKAHWVRVSKTLWIGVDTQKCAYINFKCIIEAFLPHNSVLSFLLISRYGLIIIIIIFDKTIKISITLTTSFGLLHREHISLDCKKILSPKMFNIKASLLPSFLFQDSQTRNSQFWPRKEKSKKPTNFLTWMWPVSIHYCLVLHCNYLLFPYVLAQWSPSC